MTSGQSVFLSTVEYEVVWSHLGLGAMPYPITVSSAGFHAADRTRVTAQAWERLRDRGLIDGSAVHGWLAYLMGLLAAPALSLDAVGDTGRPLRALAVRDGEQAAAALLTADGLTVIGIHPATQAATLTDLLPHHRPGPGHAFTFPHGAVREAAAAAQDADTVFRGDEHTTLVQAGMSHRDARLLAQLAGGRVRGGQFGITRWNRPYGARTRDATVVTWFDTAAGRYLAVREGDWVSVAPADSSRIAQRLDHALMAATADV